MARFAEGEQRRRFWQFGRDAKLPAPGREDLRFRTCSGILNEMMQKTALVLSGGGSRGAYEIGVWRALGELDERFEMVTGASVGAINGAVVTQGSFELAERLWRELETSRVFEIALDESMPAKKKWFFAVRAFSRAALRQGGAGAKPLERLLRSYIDEEAVRRSPVDFGVVTVQLGGMKPLYIWKNEMPRGRLIDYLLASSALFPAVKAHEIAGEKYIDGGFHDAMPIRMALDRGADRVIAVNIESLGVIRREKEFQNYDIREIRSYWDLGSVLLFDPACARQNMRIGYLDTMRSYGVYDGFAFAFLKGTLAEITRGVYRDFYEKIALLGFGTVRESFLPSVAYAAVEKRIFRRGITPAGVRGFALDGAECAGELFGLEPGTLYSLSRFCERLREAVSDTPLPEGIRQADFAGDAGLSALLSALPDRRARVRALANIIFAAFGGGQRRNLLPLAALMTDEFSAALFLALAGIL